MREVIAMASEITLLASYECERNNNSNVGGGH
jgi:hypothetical protein